MLLGRMEGSLGKSPGQYRSIPAIKRRRTRLNILNPKDDEFFGTSSYDTETSDQARKREVARLFARMRSELVEIAQEFADESEVSNMPVRQGMFIEMIIASEFVADELDSVIAGYCMNGIEAEKSGDGTKLESICRIAASYSRLRNRIGEFQRELDTMVELTMQTLNRYQFTCSLNFDPIAEGQDSNAFVKLFLNSVDEVITALTELATGALQKRDFETVAEICSCNVQLANFLADAKAAVAELGNHN